MIKLYYKTETYKDENGKDHTYKKYYLNLNERYVPIRQVYYQNKEHEKTNLINSVVLGANADPLPKKEGK